MLFQIEPQPLKLLLLDSLRYERSLGEHMSGYRVHAVHQMEQRRLVRNAFSIVTSEPICLRTRLSNR